METWRRMRYWISWYGGLIGLITFYYINQINGEMATDEILDFLVRMISWIN